MTYSGSKQSSADVEQQELKSGFLRVCGGSSLSPGSSGASLTLINESELKEELTATLYTSLETKMAAAEEASRPFAGLSDVSISEDIPVEGDISVPSSSRRDEEFSTLDEPVKETILRDLRAVGYKFIHVLYPKRSSALLRDWDLWGPLLLCVALALMLQGGAADSEDQGGPQFAEVRRGLGSGGRGG